TAIFVIFITSIWPIIINTALGVRSVSEDYLNVAKVLQLTAFEKVFQIILPVAVPFIFTGMRLSLGIAWLVIVAAEMLTGGVGIGFFIWDAWNSSRLADIVVALGQESMSLAPHALLNSRTGKKYGAMELVDLLDHDGLVDSFDRISMGALTEGGNGGLGIDRAAQDAVAAASHQNAAKSRAFLSGEIEPYPVESRKGTVLVTDDDGVREDTTVETLAALKPAFAKENGTITAGNASQLTDGAAALVLMSAETAAARKVKPIAEIGAHALVAGPDTSLHSQPANAIAAALAKAGLKASDLVAVEINEAFASVAVQSAKQLGISLDIVNPHGGAIALGHPIGASGARLTGTLARQLQEAGAGSLGAAALCGGGGQGSALVLRGL
ncbi:MAG: acetyl-CoA C-acyltransferase, partial [Rhodoglobus sp.]